MFATAISVKPAATCSGPRVSPVSAVIWLLSSVNFAFVISASRGWSPCSPKTRGKWSGWMRPSRTLAWGTVSGPPRRGQGGAGAAPAAVRVQAGAAARGHGVDGQHRGAHPHAGDLRLVLALELAGEVRHVGGGAPHVEADGLGEARVRGRAGP